MDKCDQCVAPGRVIVMRGTATLTLCAHHFRAGELALIAAGWEVVDDSRDELAAH